MVPAMGLDSRKADGTMSSWLSTACSVPFNNRQWGLRFWSWSQGPGQLVPFLEGAVETPKEWSEGSSLVELPAGSTTSLYKDFTLLACTPGGSELWSNRSYTWPRTEALDNRVQFKVHKAGFLGYYRIMTGNLLIAKVTVKGTSYFKAANRHLILVNL